MQKLYIPEGVKTKSEIFNGFGFTQFMQTGIVTAIAGVISYVAYTFHHSLPFLITSILIVCAMAVTVLTKDATNQSVVDYEKNMIAFSKTQKKYSYRAREELFK